MSKPRRDDDAAIPSRCTPIRSNATPDCRVKEICPVKPNFNQHVATYKDQIRRSQSFAGADQTTYLRIKVNALKWLVQIPLREHAGRRPRARGVGCGMGLMERRLARASSTNWWESIRRNWQSSMRKQAVPGVRFESYDGHRLPFPAQRFDVAFAACVMHHIPPPQWPEFLKEIERVLKPGGLAVVFEAQPL